MTLRFLTALAVVLMAQLHAFAEFNVSFSSLAKDSGSTNQYFDVFVMPTQPATSYEVTGMTLSFSFANTGSGAWITPSVSNALANPGFHFESAPVIGFNSYNVGLESGFTSIFASPVLSSTNNVAIARMYVDPQNLTPGSHSFNYDFEFDVKNGSQIINSGVGAVAAVPEPGSMALLGLMAAGGAAYRRFRKKAPKGKELEAV